MRKLIKKIIGKIIYSKAINSNDFLKDIRIAFYRSEISKKSPNEILVILKNVLSKYIIFEKNYDLNNTIIIAGAGRSRNTWLAETLANFLHYRLINEPFFIFKNWSNVKYIPLNYKNKTLYNIIKKILNGSIRGRRIDVYNTVFKPKGRIIKATRINLYLKWIRNHFPEVSIIFIIRHPCGVISSKKKRNWYANLELIIKQESLINDYIKPYLDEMSSAKNKI